MIVMKPFKLLFTGLIAVILTFSAVGSDYDYIIENARIADGTGAPLVSGRIAIKDGIIAAVGEFSGSARETIDGSGLVAAPGFIDVHTHSEMITSKPEAMNFVRMGLTTIITGNCGSSRTNLSEFFREAEAAGLGLNIGSLIGHGSVRKEAMRGIFMRTPTEEELAKMCDLVAQGMKDGAVGLSTGLIYVPGTYSKTDEVIALAKVAHQYDGIYASHMRHEDLRIREALDELFHIIRESGCPAEVSHIKLSGPTAWGRADEIIAQLDKARAEGLKITHDMYTYTASSTALRQVLPQWALEGKEEDFVARINNPVTKARIIAEAKATLKSEGRDDYSHVFLARCIPNESLNGKNIPEATEIMKGNASLDHQLEAILEIQAGGGASSVYHNMDEPDLERFLRHPLSMIACDGWPLRPGKDVPHPRSYGNNARLLARYVREKKVLSLEEGIRRMTSLPARTFDLARRGEIAKGYHADLVLFDPDKVQDPATFREPHQYATGIPWVFVNGEPVIRDGEDSGKRPGRAVRKGK